MNATGHVQAPGVSAGIARHAQPAASCWQSRARDYVLLSKPRLSSLVLLTTVVGFYFGSGDRLDLLALLDTLFGTALVAIGASALNQLLERRSDALMSRTADRPLPAGRMSPGEVLYIGAASAIAGLLYLALRVNLETGFFAALTFALYIFVYTPLKRISSLNTLIGALPGALPPLIGWAAARGELTVQAWALFAIIFIWQLPHFLAIAWLYRQDYAQAGMKMLPGVDPDGASTGRQIAVHSLTLLPLSLLPTVLGMAAGLYAVSAVALSAGLVYFGMNFAFKRNDAAARKLFLASVAYLPLLLALMMVDSVH